MFGAFSEENQKAIQDCTKDVDAEDLLIQELQLLTAREAFLLQRITAAQEKKQHIQSVHTSKSSSLLPGWMRIKKKRPTTRRFTLSG